MIIGDQGKSTTHNNKSFSSSSSLSLFLLLSLFPPFLPLTKEGKKMLLMREKERRESFNYSAIGIKWKLIAVIEWLPKLYLNRNKWPKSIRTWGKVTGKYQNSGKSDRKVPELGEKWLNSSERTRDEGLRTQRRERTQDKIDTRMMDGHFIRIFVSKKTCLSTTFFFQSFGPFLLPKDSQNIPKKLLEYSQNIPKRSPKYSRMISEIFPDCFL